MLRFFSYYLFRFLNETIAQENAAQTRTKRGDLRTKEAALRTRTNVLTDTPSC